MGDLRTAAQQAIALICSARLCEVNSMSSRQEMLRLMIEATDTLSAALAEPVQEPLTEEQIADAANSVKWSQQYHVDFARAIERAHGIGGNDESA